MEPDEKRHKDDDDEGDEMPDVPGPLPATDQNGMPVVTRAMLERNAAPPLRPEDLQVFPSLPGDPKDHVRVPAPLARFLMAGQEESAWKVPPHLTHLFKRELGNLPQEFQADWNKAIMLDAHIENSEFKLGGIMRRRVKYLGMGADGRHVYHVTTYMGDDEQGRPIYKEEVTSDLPEARQLGKGPNPM